MKQRPTKTHRWPVAALLLSLVTGLGASCGSVPRSASDVLGAVPFGEGRRATRRAQKAIALGILEEAAVPSQDALVWTSTDDGGHVSFWMRGNAYRLDLLLARHQLVISAGGGLWFWEETEHEVPLCDCDAWRLVAFEGECPVTDEPATAISVTMRDRLSDEEISLREPPSRPEDASPLAEFASVVEPLGSVGHLLFLRHLEQGRTCEDGGEYSREEFAVIDLRSGLPAQILDDEERDRVDEGARLEAFELVRSDAIAAVKDASDLTLLAVEPRLDLFFGLGIDLRFSAEAALDSESGAWTAAYAGNVLVPADWTPRSMSGFLVPPAVIRSYASGGSADLSRGWSVVEIAPENLTPALTAFAARDDHEKE